MAGLEGRTLHRYELQSIIGRGGMADVYLAYDPVFERAVAVKVFKREDEDLLRRFIREARLMASLNHPHLMPVYDAGEAPLDGLLRYYIVMPLMEGGSLRTRIRRAPLSLEEVCSYLSALADALDYLHGHGVIHRDIKSSNVLLDDVGNCYLSDLGVARTENDSTQVTSTGSVLGTVDYVAPELFEVNRRADARSDLYSLGVLLFEMVTGELPFKADNQIALATMQVSKPPPSPHSLVPGITPRIERVMLRALDKQPDRRYSSARMLAASFCQAIADEDTLDAVGIESLPTAVEHDRDQIAAPIYAELPPQASTLLQPARPQLSVVRASDPKVPPSTEAGTVSPSWERAYRSAARGRAHGPVLAVIALCALLAVVVPVGLVFFLYQHDRTPPVVPLPGQTQTAAAKGSTTIPTQQGASATSAPDLTATAQAVAASTMQATRHATATAIAQVTATAQAGPGATAGVVQTATAGSPDYSDPLNDPNRAETAAAEWDQNNNNCTFESDGYHVTEPAGLINFHGCRESGKIYQNAAIVVDVSIISGHSGGLFFHVNTNLLGAYSGYLFEIDSQGNYKISRSKNFSVKGDTVILQDWIFSHALKTGNNVRNTLQVIVRNGTLLFYVNGVFLSPAYQDVTYPSGAIAFLATTTPNGPSADIRYNNVRVYAL